MDTCLGHLAILCLCMLCLMYTQTSRRACVTQLHGNSRIWVSPLFSSDFTLSTTTCSPRSTPFPLSCQPMTHSITPTQASPLATMTQQWIRHLLTSSLVDEDVSHTTTNWSFFTRRVAVTTNGSTLFSHSWHTALIITWYGLDTLFLLLAQFHIQVLLFIWINVSR